MSITIWEYAKDIMFDKLKEYEERYPRAMADEEVRSFIDNYCTIDHIGDMSAKAFEETMSLMLSSIEQKKRVEEENSSLYVLMWTYIYSIYAPNVDALSLEEERRQEVLNSIDLFVTKLADKSVELVKRKYQGIVIEDTKLMIDLVKDLAKMSTEYTDEWLEESKIENKGKVEGNKDE